MTANDGDEDMETEISTAKAEAELKEPAGPRSVGLNNSLPRILKKLGHETTSLAARAFHVRHKRSGAAFQQDSRCSAGAHCRGKRDPGNYKPISLTSIACRALGRTLKERIPKDGAGNGAQAIMRLYLVYQR